MKLLITYMLFMHDCLQVTTNESEKNYFNSKLSAAVNFIIKSVSASSVRVIGCNSCIQNDFNGLTENWHSTVSLTLLNMETKYKLGKKIPKNEFILILVDRKFTGGYFEKFLVNMKGRIRKHKMLVILESNMNCPDNE